LLRDQLKAVREHYDPEGRTPLSRNMVVAGHSMGGILTHTLVVEMGDHLWNQFSDTPFDQATIDPANREKLRQLAFFDPDPAVRRAVYFSAPHRGAKMAQAGYAGLISGLAKLPGDLIRSTADAIDPLVPEDSNLKVDLARGKFTSVQSLEPGAPMVAALDKAPYK
jgi:pimeloyl-ACP methyl ester carboxylesterase